MPVAIAIVDLVSLSGTRPLWPLEFEGLIAKLEESPADRDQMAVIADWLKDNDEPALETAFRYVVKRPEIQLNHAGDQYKWWTLREVPFHVTQQKVEPTTDETAAGAFARLAKQLEAARRDLE